MSQLNSQLRFNDDGTPRRRYELDQAPESRAALSTTIALALASAVALVKNVLFSARPFEQTPLPGNASTETATAAIESGIVQLESDVDLLRMQYLDEGVNDGPVPLVRSNQPAFHSVPVAIDGNAATLAHQQAGSHIASNDNRALYGAAPGHAVQLAANDAVHLFPNLSEGKGARAFDSNALSGDGDSDTLIPGQHVPAGDGDGDPSEASEPFRQANRAPAVTGPASLGNRFINQVIVIGLTDLLVNASDADADQLAINDLTPSSGTLVAAAGGGWNFIPDPESQDEVTFNYTVSDGHVSVRATATLTLAATASEQVSATPDSLFARVGSSSPVTEVRDDYAKPIAEKIILSGAAISGTAGDDVITGTQGNDQIWAGRGHDIVDGGDGDDVIHGEDGNDHLTGGKGNDLVSGDDGDDTIIATAGDGDDVYDGGEGSDTLDLTAIGTPEPASAVLGTAEAPQAASEAGAPGLAVEAAVALFEPSPDIVADLEAGSVDGEMTGHDSIVNIENVASGSGDDTLLGNEHANNLDGGAGDDHIEGKGGGDTLQGGAGNDSLTGGKGNDVVSGGDGDDTIVAAIDDGNDVYDGGAGNDTLDLTAIGKDVAPVTTAVVSVPAAPNPVLLAEPVPPAEAAGAAIDSAAAIPAVTAEAPADEAATEAVPATEAGTTEPEAVPVAIEVADAHLAETVTVQEPSLDIVVDLEAGTVDGGMTGHDSIVNIENVASGGGDDTLLGDEHGNNLSAGAGDDHIEGRSGDDTLDGGAGRDVVDGGDGNDVIVATADGAADDYRGGDGSDTIEVATMDAGAIVDLREGTITGAGLGNDTISGIENVNCGDGNDTIIANDEVNLLSGGAGDDLFIYYSTASIGEGHGGHDKILDFEVGDKIDISEISKEFAKKLDDLYGDQDVKDFVIIGSLDEFSKPGQLKIIYNEETDSTFIYGNIDFDSDAEFELELKGNHAISESDFHHH